LNNTFTNQSSAKTAPARHALPACLTVAITGGIACGKSEVAGCLRADGVPVLDTDAIAHALLTPGHAVFERVVATFGCAYLNKEGGLDRRRLGEHVFRDASARGALNAIMHPVIYDEVFAWINQQRSEHPCVAVVVPLLYETGMAHKFDRVLVVAADEDVAMRRMFARGWTVSEARDRLNAQLPLAEKTPRADAVIWNNEDLPSLHARALEAWRAITEGKEAKQ
jgi:dephospho-CoA kinase